ncbi:LuxR C-terminal-related transcriptional regulator [Kitasatospora sp. NPDC090091]|uniref:LuxR C-terminal-related transcriptional regulator n=1 Tax=Kitasatospora sp. NPDC090091 TaxID=3364081 RepID=UPI00380F6F65
MGLTVAESRRPGPGQTLDEHLDGLREHARAVLAHTEALPKTVHQLAGSSWPDTAAVELLVGMDYINRRIATYLEQATESMCAAQPAPRTARVIRGSYQRDFPLLTRGVAMRTIYPDSHRLDEPTSKWVATMTEQGAEVRTLARPFQQVVIIDSKVAFIPSVNAPGPEEPQAHAEALLVKDPALVRYIVAEFEARWNAASQWRPSEELQLAPVQSVILQLLAHGRSQEAIGRELGISTRTVAKHVAAAREVYGVDSVTALMYVYGVERAAQNAVRPT